MARRSNKKDETVETEATEATVETNTETTEGTEVPAEGTDTKANTEPDLTEFKAAIDSALQDADSDTGVLPVVAREKIATAYRNLEGLKAKNAAKSLIDDGVREAIHASNLAHARSYAEMRDVTNETKATKSSAPKAPADPNVAYAHRLASLSLAQTIVGNDVPEGVDLEKAREQADELAGSLGEQVEQYLAWAKSDAEDKGDAPEVSPVVKAAYKLATGKATGSARTGGGGYEGPRGNIAKHIQEAFADKNPGDFMKVSEIAAFKSSEYPNKPPSQGAVSARLFPESGNCTVEGIEPVQKGENQPRGARKVA